MDLAIIDGHGYFADNYLSEAIVMNANYQGYPLGTPMGRAFVVMAAVDVLKRADATFRYVVHGCVRRQNTRVRIEQLASTHEILGYGPLSIGSPLDRQTKIRLLKGYGIEAVSQDSFATDENIWNRAVEGLNLNDLKVKIDDKAIFSWTKPIEDTPNNADYLTLVFSRGTLISINGIKTCLHKMIEKVLFLGAEHGVGRVMVIEDTIPLFSEKIRDYYEAPSAMIITAAHKLIESCVLTKQERDEKERLDKEWGEQVYAGNWFYPSVRNMAQRGWEMQKKVSGSVTLKLFKGNICIETADIPESRLLVAREGIATY
jgi:argininosuccinate synthase